MAILLEHNQTAVNDRRSIEINSSRPNGRRRHLTTPNRQPDSIILEESNNQLLNNQLNQQNNLQSNLQSNQQAKHCCCQTSQILFYSALPDLILQHQPVIMSADMHFDHQQSINQMQIDNLTSKLSLVYTPHWIENDVFLPGNQSFNAANMSNLGNNTVNQHHANNNQATNSQVINNQAINQVNNLLNSQINHAANNQQQQQQNQLNKLDFCSPRIVRCQLNSALYQFNPRLNAKIMLNNNARRSASVSLPIDHETLRQVGYSLRMISEQFHLQRLQAKALKNQQSNNVSCLIRFFKLIVNKLPSINWKAANKADNLNKNKLSTNKSSPLKSTLNKSNQLNNNQLVNNQLDDQLDNKPDNQPDVVPMVHLIIPVRQRCHSTTTDNC